MNFMRAHVREKIKRIFMDTQDLLAPFWQFMQRLCHERRVWECGSATKD
ncbi:hypothetical protein X766_22855 [Mesorhizobium sp. LSJC255A00]|nr:hypothetical protein X766_22855 [Mesorhizobium sp. LSJC255A00]